MKLKEDLDPSYIERVHSDILTFLKNVNRLKEYEDFFELLDYWIYWRREEYDTFMQKAFGKGNAFTKGSVYYEALEKVGKRLDKAIAGLFYVDQQDIDKIIRKQLKTDGYASVDNYIFEIINNDINLVVMGNGNRDFTDLITHDVPDSGSRTRYFATYFDAWRQNANSRYISTKKIIDEVFRWLINQMVQDHYVEDTIERYGVRIFLNYTEQQFDDVYSTLKRVESALAYFARKDWGKKLLPDMEMAIDFVNPQTNFEFKTSYGMDKSAGVYISQEDLVVISKQNKVSDYIFEILAHEMGHKFYFQVMNKVGREEWKEIYDTIKNGSNMEDYFRDLAYFSDELLSFKEDYKRKIHKNAPYYHKDFSSVESYLSLIKKTYFDSSQHTLLKDFIEDYGKTRFTFTFSYDTLKEGCKIRANRFAKKEGLHITDDYDGYQLLTPAIMNVVNEKIIEYFRDSIEAESEAWLRNMPTRYAGENEKELFAEIFAANAIKSLNIDAVGKGYKVSDTLYDYFRQITGIRESYKRKRR